MLDRYVNCIAHGSSDGNLLVGNDKTALIDCGMLFCADDTIKRVNEALNGRALDYIVITHTHYDHIGAAPAFRRRWPQLQLLASETGAAILLKETPRRVFRELALAAAAKYGVACDASYSDDDFHADVVYHDKEVIPLGGVSLEVINTPGHTRDSVSFFVKEFGLLIVNETVGLLLPNGIMYPCFLTGYQDTIDSIEKCKKISHEYLSLPHRGIVSKDETETFFDKALESNAACRDFILSLLNKGLAEDEALNIYCDEYYHGDLQKYQPKDAFVTNAKAMFACITRELL